MRKVILVLLLFPLLFNIAFSDLPALPNSTCDNTALVAQIQQTQSMVVSTSEALGAKLVQLSNDLNYANQKINSIEAQNAELKAEIATRPSSAILVLVVMASGGIISSVFIGLRISGKW
jgi:peptidoglycan hydrolase CwlO-like protein